VTDDLFSQDAYSGHAGFKHTDTSIDSAKQATEYRERIQDKVLDALRRYGLMTADECADRIGLDRLSVRPRFSELRADHKIRDTGYRRKLTINGRTHPYIVWQINPTEAVHDPE
jgi:predicted ArsR family transcriptional regulator